MVDPRLATQFDLPLEGQVNAAGTLELVIEARQAVNWILTQVSVRMPTAPVGAECELRKNGIYVSTAVATGDAIGGDPPVTLRPGEKASVVWTGCTPGDIGTVLVFYDRIGFR